jgi:DNA-binding LacI/PurR family transcriptional regulator
LTDADKDRLVQKRTRAGKQQDRTYVTQKDVAKRAGVSPSIVSYVINNGPRSISQETRERVLRVIAELEYRPNVHAQMLMRASWDSELAPNQFGILIGGKRDILKRPYYPNLLFGILEEAAVEHFHLRFVQFYQDLSSPILFNTLFNPEEVSAIILVAAGPLLQSEEGLAKIEKIHKRVPNLVSVGRQVPNIPSVIVDLANAAYQATNHLISLGHRRVAIVGGYNRRISGYQQALQENNLPFDPALIIDIGTNFTPAAGYNGGQALLASGLLHAPQPVTAIMAINDEIAMGVMRCLQENGVHIPRDVSIVGMDDHELGMYFTPALTTLKIPYSQVGIQAIQTILHRVGRTEEPPPLTILPAELIVRESCTSPA